MRDKEKLSSWKEIAGHLGIGVRTAQRWEKKLQLPVRRLNDSPGTFVYAYKDELDKWFFEKVQSGNLLERRLFNKKYLFVVLIITGVLLAAVFLVFLPYLNNTIPIDFKIEGENLVFLNQAGKKIGTYVFNPAPEPKEYNPDSKDLINTSAASINIFFKDINKDNRIEVVFVLQTKDNREEKIFCFNQKGSLMWSFLAGKDIEYDDYIYSSYDFDIHLARVIDLDNDGFSEIVVIANHKMFFPTRVLVLDHRGKLRGEYWNSGHLACMEFLDLDDDGFKEIILGGLNNNYDSACIVVLDPRRIEGSAPQVKGSDYYSDDLGAGSEKYYLLIPPDEVSNQLNENHYEVFIAIALLETNTMLFETKYSGTLYEFDYGLSPSHLHLRDKFTANLEKLRSEGKIQKDLDRFDKKEILGRIRYWNGERWVKSVTMTEYWREFIQSKILP